MDEAQKLSSEDKEHIAGDVMESIGVAPDETANDTEDTQIAEKDDSHELPDYAKKRMGMQEKRHQRAIRELHSEIAALKTRASPQFSSHDPENPPLNPYTGEMIQPGSDEDRIHKAIKMALHHKDMEAQRANEDANKAYVGQQYQNLDSHLDSAANKYDDFDDVVRHPDARFTEHIKNASLILPHSGPGSAAEVLYKLGKNKDELNRISQLHPLDQAREVVRLSHDLIASHAGGTSKKAQDSPHMLHGIKSNPVTNTSHAVNEKTSISDLRKRMKAGWK